MGAGQMGGRELRARILGSARVEVCGSSGAEVSGRDAGSVSGYATYQALASKE
jgi:hypothetical protein